MHASIQATAQNGQLAKPIQKKNKLLVYLTDGDMGYEIGLCLSLQILFLTQLRYNILTPLE